MEYTAGCTEGAEEMRAAVPAACPRGGDAGNKKVLIAEDYQMLQLLYSEELAEEGYDVAVCGDCATLLKMIEMHRPDIILLDIMLGEHNALDMLHDIYALSRGALVLLNSAYSHAYSRSAFGVAGADYLVKSADIQPMKDKIRSLCAQQAGRLRAKSLPV